VSQTASSRELRDAGTASSRDLEQARVETALSRLGQRRPRAGTSGRRSFVGRARPGTTSSRELRWPGEARGRKGGGGCGADEAASEAGGEMEEGRRRTRSRVREDREQFGGGGNELGEIDPCGFGPRRGDAGGVFGRGRPG
jgi:hypothetical protein